MKKKWLAGILTICMLLSILPTNALAAGEGADAETGEQENAAIEGTLDTVGGTDSNEVLEEKATGVAQIGTTTYATLKEAVENAEDGDTIELLDDSSGNGIVIDTSKKSLVIDFSTYTYTVDGSTVGSAGTETNGFQFLTGGSLTLKNGTIVFANKKTLAIGLQNYCDLTLENMVIDASQASWPCQYAVSNNCGNVSFTGNTSIKAYNGWYSFDSCKFGEYAVPTVSVDTTGTITGKVELSGGNLAIKSGTFNGEITEAGPVQGTVTITGGKFTADPSKYVPEDTYAVFSINEGNYKFVVSKAVTSITLPDTLSLALNESHTLTAKVEPDDAYAQTVTWASNNETVATVDQNGVVTAEAIGKATITATIGDKSATCEVSVSYAPVANVTLDHDKLSMVEGSTTTITATVTPNNADKTVVWTSDKESVATVVDGIITAVAPGTATITATVGGKSASCVVTVVAKPDEDETAVVPSVEEPAVKVDAELPQEVEQTVTEAAQSVDAGQAMTGAAQQEAAALDRNEAKQEQLLAEAASKGVVEEEGKPVVLYTQTYLEIQVTEAKAEGSEVTSVTMDITPKMQIVASTAASSADIDLEGADKNAVVVESSGLSLTRAEITVQLPGNFAQELVFIRHEAEKGVFHYQDQADAQGVVTFTTSHGFSPFTFSLTDGAAAWIDSAGYDTLAQAVDAVDNGETITLARDNSEEIQVNREVSFSVAPGEHKFDQKNITAGRRYDMSVSEKDGVYTYTFERESTGGSTDRPEGDYAIRVEAGKNGTVKVSPSRADKGDTVTITVKPNKGYELDELIVTDSKGNELELTEKSANKKSIEK